MTETTPKRPIALTIAGSDSSGGAGIQADLKTFTALGAYGATVLTALTAQNTTGVQAVLAIPPAFVAAQLESVLDDLDVGAAKTGMLANAQIIRAVALAMANQPRVPLIVDPVMVATSGDRLLQQDAVAAMRQELFPLATLITPNLDEAAALLETDKATSRAQMADQARRLLEQGAKAVLLKGGHFPETDRVRQAADVLLAPDGEQWFTAEWVETPNTHGTGCTLAAAIAAGCAAGQDLPQAIDAAKTFLTRALVAGRELGVGRGHGPVDHLV